jgi:phosphatidylinositol alpha-1,6-mannosyltransferase
MVGGMEKLSFALAQEFSKNSQTSLITWGKSQKYLPFFIFIALCKALYIIPTKHITHVYIGDGLLAPLGLILKALFGIRITITIVGLDITFNFPGYQFLIPRCVAAYDKIFCISDATCRECVKRGIPKEKCVVIPCGIYPQEFKSEKNKVNAKIILGKKIGKKRILITVGRLVKRKGVAWFVSNVLPVLNKNIVYIVIGEGPEQEKIAETVKNLGLEKQVFLLGKIDDATLKTLYQIADIFVMPNIPVEHTMEGFGIVAIEASANGLPVIASRLEGIAAAVVEGKNGILVTPQKKNEWIRVINRTLKNPLPRKQTREWTNAHYSWEIIGNQYRKYL